MYKYFNAVGFEIASWKSKELFNEEISSVSNPKGAVLKIVYDNARIKVKFNGNLLKQDKVTCNHGLILNIYIVYRLFILLAAVKVTNASDADPDKWQYSGYGICFDSTGSFTHPNGNHGKLLLSLELI